MRAEYHPGEIGQKYDETCEEESDDVQEHAIQDRYHVTGAIALEGLRRGVGEMVT